MSEQEDKIAEKQKFLEDNIEHLRERLTVCRSKIMRTSETKFMVNEILQLPTSFKADLPMPTAGTNGKETFIDPEFWIKLNLNQRVMVLCHETMHVMFGHTDQRRKGKKADHLWNIACDCVVQAMLSMCNIGEKVDGTIWPDNTYSGHITLNINEKKIQIKDCHLKTVEAVFDELVQHAKKNPPPKGKGQGGEGDAEGEGSGDGIDEIMDGDGNKVGPLDHHDLGELTKEEREQVKDMLRRKVVEHKMRNNMPGWLAEKIEGMIKGKVNWQAELREMITPEIKTYSTFSKTNRRSGACGVILPGKFREGLDVAIAIDTSGSIGQNELKYFIGEIYNIFSQFEQVKAKILLHTSNVYQEIDVSDTKDLEKIKHQSGGTCHLDVFEKVEEQNGRVLICLTDGWSSFPPRTKIQKIVWVCTDEEGSKQIPNNLGKVIVVDKGDFKND